MGKSRRAAYQRQRPTRLSDAEKAAIRERADSCTLRELAAEFGVSHETVRAVLTKEELAAVA